MTITINKTYLFFGLLSVLAVLYAGNIFGINKIINLLVDKPVKLSFLIVSPDKEQCEKCFDAKKVVSLIKSSHNIKISGNKIVKKGDFLYDKLLNQYALKNLPAVIVSGDISDERILGSWKSFDGEKKDEAIVIQNLLPFYDIASGEEKGLIDIILLKDASCTDCFDEGEYIKMITRGGMVVKNLKVYDISSQKGADIVKQYKITKVPTIILSSDAGDYPGFEKSWKGVGTKEDDGRFVLREVEKTTNGLKFKTI